MLWGSAFSVLARQRRLFRRMRSLSAVSNTVASESYVRSIYGAPREVETKFNPLYAGGQAVEWEYGNDFDIVFVDGAVRQVEVGMPNGVQTKDDIAVGTDVNTLIAAYGQPDAIHGDKYIYFVDGDSSIGFIFEIERDRVDEIKMGLIR